MIAGEGNRERGKRRERESENEGGRERHGMTGTERIRE